MKLRIKYISQIGYFSQVKKWFVWCTIGRHPYGYSLYEPNHIDFPLDTEHEARALCKLYEQWAVNKKKPNIFIDV